VALEDALVNSANGDFGLILIGFLCVSLVGGFLWAIKKITDQNGCFNTKILIGMKDIVDGMKEYRQMTCAELEKHDAQAKTILTVTERIENTLENRPCVIGRNGGQ
jgi:hypothetical protein